MCFVIMNELELPRCCNDCKFGVLESDLEVHCRLLDNREVERFSVSPNCPIIPMAAPDELISKRALYNHYVQLEEEAIDAIAQCNASEEYGKALSWHTILADRIAYKNNIQDMKPLITIGEDS